MYITIANRQSGHSKKARGGTSSYVMKVKLSAPKDGACGALAGQPPIKWEWARA